MTSKSEVKLIIACNRFLSYRFQHVETLGDALEGYEDQECESDGQQNSSQLLLGFLGFLFSGTASLCIHLLVHLEDAVYNQHVQDKDCDPWRQNQKHAMYPEFIVGTSWACAVLCHPECWVGSVSLIVWNWFIRGKVRGVDDEGQSCDDAKTH